MKKLFSITICLLLCAAVLCSCASPMGGKKAALNIGEADVDREVFAYYFSKVYSEAEDAGGNLLDTDSLTKEAVQRCCEYVSATTLFERLSLSLSPNNRKDVAENTESEWLLYGNYYTAAGISKQTLSKIFTVEQYRTALLLYYFGEGSEYEVTESEIEHYFDQTYVAFQAINGYLTTTDDEGKTVPVSAEEAASLRTSFENKRQLMADGTSMADVNDGIEVSSTFVAVSNTAYPEGFLEKVSALAYNTPTVIEAGDYIFLVVRLDAKQGEENYYSHYRTDYIEALRGDMLTEMLVATANEYEVEQHNRTMKKAADGIIEERNSRK